MKSSRIPAILLVVLYICFVVFVALSVQQLPARVATHFDGEGNPNGWMTRSTHITFILIFGFAFPLSLVGLLWLARLLPESLINIPKRDYWLAPERRAQTFAYLFQQSFWFACIGVAFVIGLHALILRANSQASQTLPGWTVGVLACSFLVAIGIWIIAMVRHFIVSARH
jgi:serine/threonine-protein kinase